MLEGRESNLANQFTKKFSPSCHSRIRPMCLYDQHHPNYLNSVVNSDKTRETLLKRSESNFSDNMQGCGKHASAESTWK